MSNNNNNNNSMPGPESEEEEEELSGSYNINGSPNSSSSSSSAASSSNSSADSSNSSSSDGDEDEDDDDASDQDMHSDSESDDANTTQSDELELAQLTNRHLFRLPRGLCERASIFHEFFSLETWQMLPQGMQAQLQPLLPSYSTILTSTQAAAEQQRTLLQLFNGGLQRFGQSPLLRLQRQLEEGSLRPDVLQLRRSIERSQRRERRFQHAERLSQLAKELFLSREQMLQQVFAMTPPPDGAKDAFKAPPRPRKRKTPSLHRENKFCVERARKRYCQELVDLARELQLQPGDISADEQDEEEAAKLIIQAEQQQLKADTISSRPSNAADKKCIYSSFFKRRQGIEDDQVLRSMQSDKMQPLSDKNFKKYLRDFKRRKLQQPQLPDFDTSDIRLRDICTRAQFVGNFKPGRKPKALSAVRFNSNVNEPPALVPIGGNPPASLKQEPIVELLTDEPQQLYGRAALEPDEEELEPELQEQTEQTAPRTITPQLPKLEPIGLRTVTLNTCPKALIKAGAHITGSPTRDAAGSATPRGQACYFSLLRDLFVSTPQHRLTYAELQLQFTKWRTESCSAGLPEWLRTLPADWTHLLQSAVHFLSGDFVTLPAEYVPYIEHKTQLNIYQWIGAGRDSDARLQTLCQYWLLRRKEESPQQQFSPLLEQHQQPQQLNSVAQLDCAPTPPPRCPTTWTVRVATQQEMLEFQRQERLRFEQPHRPFTYRLHGYESVVGPVKGIYTQSLALNKARGHAVMVDDRPPYVTILTLVRDATARLPNGEGTRSEISELLKCSQYINRQAAENVLQTIVSGALDRMHGGVDPCVRYDARRKIWIYLHRNRSEADFERMHRQNQTLVKQKQQQRKHNNSNSSNNNKPKKEEDVAYELPALVAATASAGPTTTIITPLVKKQQSLPLKCPPVPPLKYHIPPASATPIGATVTATQLTQKSLLKPTQRGSAGMVTIVDRPTVQVLKTPTKPQQQQLQQQQPQQPQQLHNFSPSRNTTPILVSTPTGLQTVHVAATPNKKLTIKKPIVINSQQTPPTVSALGGSFIVPLDQQQQLQQQQQANNLGNKVSPVRQQMPKNIIRLLPAGGGAIASATATSTATSTTTAAGVVASKPTVVQLPHITAGKHPGAVQILGPRMLAQTTVRPLQQKIGAVSIVSNKPGSGGSPIANATTTSTGTIVKMSPQAFATLQQQQMKHKAANPAQNQQQPQQRILVGNTAISSNKNIVFQTLPKAAPKILSTLPGQAKQLSTNTTNLSPQQQRIVLQGFKQPAVVSTASAAASTTTTPTRLIRTTPVTAIATSGSPTAGATQGGHIITLDSLLQKSTPGKLLTAGSNIIQLATSTASGNVITLSPSGQQQQSPKQLPTTARIVTAGQTTMMPKIIGKTTVVPGKPLLLHAKTLKLGGSTPPTATTTTTLSSSGLRTTAQNIVIGGQTVKLQGTTIPARNAAGTPMQTVIMGNQLLRLATSSSSLTSNTTNSLPISTSGIASAPKTLLIGGGAGQTLRLGKNVLLATSSGNNSQSTTTTTATTSATSGNNLVFAVQGNGGQLFFSQGLQGVNFKPLSSMKVIPMSSAGATATIGGGIKLTNAVDAVATKTINSKLLPTAVLKTAGAGNGN